MIAIHSVGSLTANISTSAESNWVSLVITAPDGETTTELTLYFATRRRGFAEEHRYALALAEAINSVRPMDVGNWGDPELEQDNRLHSSFNVEGTVTGTLEPIRETEAPAEEELYPAQPL